MLVCSVGSNLMLSVGAIANAMSKAAGPELQLALLEAAKEATADLDEGDIISTIPGKLSCRHVIHCLCCPWKDGSNEKKQVSAGTYHIMNTVFFCKGVLELSIS